MGKLVLSHTHRKLPEVIIVVKDTVYMAFQDTVGKLYAVMLKMSDFFMFPQDLVYF